MGIASVEERDTRELLRALCGLGGGAMFGGFKASFFEPNARFQKQGANEILGSRIHGINIDLLGDPDPVICVL